MRSPVLAMSWENWRLTASEIVWRLSFGLIGGAAALSLSQPRPTVAVWILLSQHAMFSMAIAKLTGGRFMDGYRPGFPLPLLYTRPVRTSLIVGVPMLYDAVSGAVMYAASAALLGFVFGQALPVLSLAMLIVAFRIVCLFVQWSTQSRVFQWVGSMLIWGGVIALVNIRAGGSILQLDFSLAETAVMALVGVVSFPLTVAGVARQRRGDARAAIPRTKGSVAADWFAGVFRFPCPTSSPVAAQVWFDLRTTGVPVLALGVALAIAIPLLVVVTTWLDVLLSGLFEEPLTRSVSFIVSMFALPAVLLFGGNAFSIRPTQERTALSLFAATQAFGTARLAALKVLVRSACLLTALAAVVTSIWISASVIPFDVLHDNDTFIEKSSNPVSGVMRAIEGAVVAMSPFQQLALAFVIVVVVSLMVGSRATFMALRARYRRPVHIAGSLVLFHVLALVLLVVAEQYGIVSQFALSAAQYVTGWVLALAAVASVVAIVYLFWATVSERLLMLRHVCGALVFTGAFIAAWLTVLGVARVPLGTMSAVAVAGMLSPALLLLALSVLAPWSLSRVRHT